MPKSPRSLSSTSLSKPTINARVYDHKKEYLTIKKNRKGALEYALKNASSANGIHLKESTKYAQNISSDTFSECYKAIFPVSEELNDSGTEDIASPTASLMETENHAEKNKIPLFFNKDSALSLADVSSIDSEVFIDEDDEINEIEEDEEDYFDEDSEIDDEDSYFSVEGDEFSVTLNNNNHTTKKIEDNFEQLGTSSDASVNQDDPSNNLNQNDNYLYLAGKHFPNYAQKIFSELHLTDIDQAEYRRNINFDSTKVKNPSPKPTKALKALSLFLNPHSQRHAKVEKEIKEIVESYQTEEKIYRFEENLNKLQKKPKIYKSLEEAQLKKLSQTIDELSKYKKICSKKVWKLVAPSINLDGYNAYAVMQPPSLRFEKVFVSNIPAKKISHGDYKSFLKMAGAEVTKTHIASLKHAAYESVAEVQSTLKEKVGLTAFTTIASEAMLHAISADLVNPAIIKNTVRAGRIPPQLFISQVMKHTHAYPAKNSVAGEAKVKLSPLRNQKIAEALETSVNTFAEEIKNECLKQQTLQAIPLSDTVSQEQKDEIKTKLELLLKASLEASYAEQDPDSDTYQSNERENQRDAVTMAILASSMAEVIVNIVGVHLLISVNPLANIITPAISLLTRPATALLRQAVTNWYDTKIIGAEALAYYHRLEKIDKERAQAAAKKRETFDADKAQTQRLEALCKYIQDHFLTAEEADRIHRLARFEDRRNEYELDIQEETQKIEDSTVLLNILKDIPSNKKATHRENYAPLATIVYPKYHAAKQILRAQKNIDKLNLKIYKTQAKPKFAKHHYLENSRFIYKKALEIQKPYSSLPEAWLKIKQYVVDNPAPLLFLQNSPDEKSQRLFKEVLEILNKIDKQTFIDDLKTPKGDVSIDVNTDHETLIKQWLMDLYQTALDEAPLRKTLENKAKQSTLIIDYDNQANVQSVPLTETEILALNYYYYFDLNLYHLRSKQSLEAHILHAKKIFSLSHQLNSKNSIEPNQALEKVKNLILSAAVLEKKRITERPIKLDARLLSPAIRSFQEMECTNANARAEKLITELSPNLQKQVEELTQAKSTLSKEREESIKEEVKLKKDLTAYTADLKKLDPTKADGGIKPDGELYNNIASRSHERQEAQKRRKKFKGLQRIFKQNKKSIYRKAGENSFFFAASFGARGGFQHLRSLRASKQSLAALQKLRTELKMLSDKAPAEESPFKALHGKQRQAISHQKERPNSLKQLKERSATTSANAQDKSIQDKQTQKENNHQMFSAVENDGNDDMADIDDINIENAEEDEFEIDSESAANVGTISDQENEDSHAQKKNKELTHQSSRDNNNAPIEKETSHGRPPIGHRNDNQKGITWQQWEKDFQATQSLSSNRDKVAHLLKICDDIGWLPQKNRKAAFDKVVNTAEAIRKQGGVGVRWPYGLLMYSLHSVVQHLDKSDQNNASQKLKFEFLPKSIADEENPSDLAGLIKALPAIKRVNAVTAILHMLCHPPQPFHNKEAVAKVLTALALELNDFDDDERIGVWNDIFNASVQLQLVDKDSQFLPTMAKQAKLITAEPHRRAAFEKIFKLAQKQPENTALILQTLSEVNAPFTTSQLRATNDDENYARKSLAELAWLTTKLKCMQRAPGIESYPNSHFKKMLTAILLIQDKKAQASLLLLLSRQILSLNPEHQLPAWKDMLSQLSAIETIAHTDIFPILANQLSTLLKSSRFSSANEQIQTYQELIDTISVAFNKAKTSEHQQQYRLLIKPLCASIQAIEDNDKQLTVFTSLLQQCDTLFVRADGEYTALEKTLVHALLNELIYITLSKTSISKWDALPFYHALLNKLESLGTAELDGLSFENDVQSLQLLEEGCTKISATGAELISVLAGIYNEHLLLLSQQIKDFPITEQELAFTKILSFIRSGEQSQEVDTIFFNLISQIAAFKPNDQARLLTQIIEKFFKLPADQRNSETELTLFEKIVEIPEGEWVGVWSQTLSKVAICIDRGEDMSDTIAVLTAQIPSLPLADQEKAYASYSNESPGIRELLDRIKIKQDGATYDRAYLALAPYLYAIPETHRLEMFYLVLHVVQGCINKGEDVSAVLVALISQIPLTPSDNQLEIWTNPQLHGRKLPGVWDLLEIIKTKNKDAHQDTLISLAPYINYIPTQEGRLLLFKAILPVVKEGIEQNKYMGDTIVTLIGQIAYIDDPQAQEIWDASHKQEDPKPLNIWDLLSQIKEKDNTNNITNYKNLLISLATQVVDIVDVGYISNIACIPNNEHRLQIFNEALSEIRLRIDNAEDMSESIVALVSAIPYLDEDKQNAAWINPSKQNNKILGIRDLLNSIKDNDRKNNILLNLLPYIGSIPEKHRLKLFNDIVAQVKQLPLGDQRDRALQGLFAQIFVVLPEIHREQAVLKLFSGDTDKQNATLTTLHQFICGNQLTDNEEVKLKLVTTLGTVIGKIDPSQQLSFFQTLINNPFLFTPTFSAKSRNLGFSDFIAQIQNIQGKNNQISAIQAAFGSLSKFYNGQLPTNYQTLSSQFAKIQGGSASQKEKEDFFNDFKKFDVPADASIYLKYSALPTLKLQLLQALEIPNIKPLDLFKEIIPLNSFDDQGFDTYATPEDYFDSDKGSQSLRAFQLKLNCIKTLSPTNQYNAIVYIVNNAMGNSFPRTRYNIYLFSQLVSNLNVVDASIRYQALEMIVYASVTYTGKEIRYKYYDKSKQRTGGAPLFSNLVQHLNKEEILALISIVKENINNGVLVLNEEEKKDANIFLDDLKNDTEIQQAIGKKWNDRAVKVLKVVKPVADAYWVGHSAYNLGVATRRMFPGTIRIHHQTSHASVTANLIGNNLNFNARAAYRGKKFIVNYKRSNLNFFYGQDTEQASKLSSSPLPHTHDAPSSPQSVQGKVANIAKGGQPSNSIPTEMLNEFRASSDIRRSYPANSNQYTLAKVKNWQGQEEIVVIKGLLSKTPHRAYNPENIGELKYQVYYDSDARTFYRSGLRGGAPTKKGKLGGKGTPGKEDANKQHEDDIKAVASQLKESSISASQEVSSAPDPECIDDFVNNVLLKGGKNPADITKDEVTNKLKNHYILVPGDVDMVMQALRAKQAPKFVYDIHGYKHHPGKLYKGAKGTQWQTADFNSIDALMQDRIKRYVEGIRKTEIQGIKNSGVKTFYYTEVVDKQVLWGDNSSLLGINLIPAKDGSTTITGFTIQIDYDPATNTVSYHGYPDAVTRTGMFTRKTGGIEIKKDIKM